MSNTYNVYASYSGMVRGSNVPPDTGAAERRTASTETDRDVTANSAKEAAEKFVERHFAEGFVCRPFISVAYTVFVDGGKGGSGIFNISKSK